MKRLSAVSLLIASACSAAPRAYDTHDAQSPLRFVRSITLPDVRGRIDHLAIDEAGRHLFVAEIANGSVDDVDLGSGKIAGRIAGLREPQGVAWLVGQREIVVASGDGTVRFYRAADRQEVARVNLGDDADNVRIDPRNGNVVVGYGSGGLAVIDPATHQIVRKLALPAHPEAFAILESRVFVNVPHRRAVIALDLDPGRMIATWGIGVAASNFPMAADAAAHRIAIGIRVPPSMSLIDADSGKTVRSEGTCGDSDDLYFVGGWIVVVCGQGFVDLVAKSGDSSARVRTGHGARTGVMAADLKSLFVAVPNSEGSPAELRQLALSKAP